MVTCGPSKQGKLSTHKSPAVCVPTFLGSPCMATAPTTSGSHHQPIQMSNTLFEVADCYVNPPCFSPARPLRTRTPGKMFLWFSISFIISSVLHPYSPSSQRLFINMLLMGSGGWSLWLEELRTWQPYQAVSYKVGTPPFPQVWAVTAMTPSHCAFVWPVLQLLCIPTPIEWEDPPLLYRPSQQTNRPETKWVPTTLTSKQLPTVTVCLVLISHKEVLHETLESLLLSSSTAKFVHLRAQAPNICHRERKKVRN